MFTEEFIRRQMADILKRIQEALQHVPIVMPFAYLYVTPDRDPQAVAMIYDSIENRTLAYEALGQAARDHMAGLCVTAGLGRLTVTGDNSPESEANAVIISALGPQVKAITIASPFKRIVTQSRPGYTQFGDTFDLPDHEPLLKPWWGDGGLPISGIAPKPSMVM